MDPTVGTEGNDSIKGSSDGWDYIVGLGGNDTLAAGGFGQILDGLAGDDMLIGDGSSDGYGGEGNDLLQDIRTGFGDAGNDTIIGSLTPNSGIGARLHGGAGDDSIVGTSGDDFLSGGGGHDIIKGGAGNDLFFGFDKAPHGGHAGYSTTVTQNGHPGFSTIDGGAGRDTLDLSHFWGDNGPTAGDMTVDFTTGVATTSAFTVAYVGASFFIPAGRVDFSNIEAVLTGSGNDSILGSSYSDRLVGNYGADTIQGGAGDDIIQGDNESRLPYQTADSSNHLRGDGGNDTIGGGGGDDVLDGGAGDDVLDGRYGDDVLIGGDGDDRIIAGRGADTLTGGAGADVFVLSDDRDARAEFANVITDWSSEDRLEFMDGPGRSYTERTAATYEAAYEDAKAIIAADLADYIATQVGSDVVVFTNNLHANINLGDARNVLDQAVILKGKTLADISAANAGGAVEVEVGVVPPPPPPPAPDPKTLVFGRTDPTAALNISATDKVSFAGGATQASVRYNPDGTITVVMNDATSVTFGPNISAVSKAGGLMMADGSKLFIGDDGDEGFFGAATGDVAFGGQGDDTLQGGAGGDGLQGNQGRDRLDGGDGADTIYGGKDDDLLLMGEGLNFGQGNLGQDQIRGGGGAETLLGGKDNDTIYGEGGADFLNGNMADDLIIGGAGDDTILGEGGADTLWGGSGADSFHAFAGQGLDRVMDFSRAEGDRLVLKPGMAYSLAESGGDVIVSLGGADQFVLVGVSLTALTGDWIVA